MKYIESLLDLRRNMQTLNKYLNRKIEPEYSFAVERIQKGTCFVAEKTATGYQFYPSRFIGYMNNSMSDHMNNKTKDGRLTNPIITKILKSEPMPNNELEKEYRIYCRESLGFEPNERGTFGVQRKYWLL